MDLHFLYRKKLFANLLFLIHNLNAINQRIWNQTLASNPPSTKII